MKVRFCRKNLSRMSKSAFRKLKDEPDLKLKKADCLGSCRLCKERCFAVIKGKTVSAAKPGKLAKRVLKRLKSS
ncbi:YuzB family protein [Paenibacillus pasadenensis]|uniref:DUF1450 domain-containing protein n=1 Tax=Paenibacillus pasadenensis TaxID=217090 RepID=UPI0020418212|nr:DUF1450 domain-containing protein [Paenibacillus pasadenensis]MCM3747517.1 YuzB family protein [Paenibacillus pasadenensis]